MPKNKIIVFAVVSGVCALLLFSVAAFAVYKAPEARAAGVYANALLESRAGEYKSALEQRTLVRATEEGRAQVADLAGKDALAIVEALEKAGSDARISLEIDQAQTAPSSAKNKLKSVGFVVRGEGSFSAVMRALALIEHISIPSRIDEVSLEAPPLSSSRARAWNFTARVTLYTTADLAL